MSISREKLAGLGMSFARESHGISEYTLDANGLKILLMENHAAPVVTSMVVYRVGARNEGVGHTGSTHFLEHMMFKSTAAFDHALGRGIDDMLKPIGANYNATTSNDRTNYYECVPRQHLGLCLAIEADRMRNLKLKESDRASEMTVVRNEFEMGENSPEEALDKELMALAFREHPYHHPTIGWRSDVEGVPLEKLQSFYDVFYWPNNATVIIAGDFVPEEALSLVKESFGNIPPSPHKIPVMYTVEPAQNGIRRFEIRRSGSELARVLMGFHTPEAAHRDYHALCVLRDILGSSERQSSRLFKNVYDKEIVVAAYAHIAETRDPELFKLGAVVSVDSTPEAVESALLAEIEKIKVDGISATELARLKQCNRNSTASIKDDPIAFAEQLCEAEAVADWTLLVNYDDHYDLVTAEDVQRVAATYFKRENMTVGYFLPKDNGSQGEEHDNDGDAEEAAAAVEAAEAEVESGDGSESKASPEAEAEEVPEVSAVSDATVHSTPKEELKTPAAPDAAPVRSLVPDRGMDFAARVKKHTLANGLTLLFMPAAGTGVVSVSGSIRAGSYFNAPKKTLLADMTANMLMTGSRNYSKTAIGETLENLGTDLDFATDDFAITFDSTMVTNSLPNFVTLLGDVLTMPALTEEEFKKVKKDFAADLKESASDTAKVAHARLMKALYKSDHVYYHKSFLSLSKELRTYDLSDVETFYAAHYSPKSTVLCIVGDVDFAQALALVEAKFGSWSGPEAKAITVAAVQPPKSKRTIVVPMKDKASVDIRIGLPVPVKRKAADYLACRIANAALGQDTLASRLGAVVREQHGLTYGITSSFDDVAFGQAPWVIELSTNPANVDKALALVDEVVERYRKEGITDKELADEASRVYGMTVVNLRTTHAIASTLVWLDSIGLSAQTLDALNSELKTVTKEMVNEAIRAYFRLDQAVTVLAGDLVKQ